MGWLKLLNFNNIVLIVLGSVGVSLFTKVYFLSNDLGKAKVELSQSKRINLAYELTLAEQQKLIEEKQKQYEHSIINYTKLEKKLSENYKEKVSALKILEDSEKFNRLLQADPESVIYRVNAATSRMRELMEKATNIKSTSKSIQKK